VIKHLLVLDHFGKGNYQTDVFILKGKYMDPNTTEFEFLHVKHSKAKEKISSIGMYVNNAATESTSKQLQPNMNKAQILTLIISSAFCLFVA
jgi:hypothetical protein